MGYGDTDAQAVETIAEQLHDPARREEIEGFCNLSSTMPTRRKKSRQTSPFCIEEMEELPPALTPNRPSGKKLRGIWKKLGLWLPKN